VALVVASWGLLRADGLPPAPVLPTSISARSPYADGGAIRFIASGDWQGTDEDVHVNLEVRNEGPRTFVIAPGDRFSCVAASGKSTQLSSDLKLRSTIAPGDSKRVLLHGRRPAGVIGLDVACAALESTVRINEEFRDAEARDVRAASYDPGALPGDSVEVRLAAVVSADGRVERVIDPPSSGGPVPEGLRQSAHAGVSVPVLIGKVVPEWPEDARLARDQGKVILQVIIDEGGFVEHVDVLRGPRAFAGAATRAVCCWKYKPATLNGRPVSAYFAVIVDFTLQ